jgi:hypothetical protein
MMILNRCSAKSRLLPPVMGIIIFGSALLWAVPEEKTVAADSSLAYPASTSSTADAQQKVQTATNKKLGARIPQPESGGNGMSQPERTLLSMQVPASLGPASPPSSAQASSEPPAAAPAEKTGSDHSIFDKLTLSGLVDVYYGYNFNRPDSRKDGLRNFDINSSQFSLSLAKISIERLPEPFGFRADFIFGDTAKMVHSTEPAGTDLYQFLEQVYGSYKAPIGKGLTIDFGKFVTQHGAEVIESKDNWNYSRSILFSWAIPYYHFGARARYPVGDKLSLTATVTNGWNNVVDNNTGKTYGFQAAVNPTKKLSIVQNYMVGPEQTNGNSDWRHLWDTTVTYTATSALSLMANYDYGMDRASGARVRWQGIAGYARVQIAPWFAISPRMEWFTDPQGYMTGLAQDVKEGTFTTEFKIQNSLLLRGEYRYDWSNQPSFEKRNNAFSRDQQTLTFGVVYMLSQAH